MRVYHPGKIEKRAVSGAVLAWMLVFLLGVTLIWGHVRYYELTLRNEERQEELQELQAELTEKKIAQQQTILNITSMAEALDMYKPTPEEYTVIHVR